MFPILRRLTEEIPATELWYWTSRQILKQKHLESADWENHILQDIHTTFLQLLPTGTGKKQVWVTALFSDLFSININPLVTIYFEAENNRFRASSKSARVAGLESARTPAMARGGIRPQAPIQLHTSRIPGNVYFYGSLIFGTPVVNRLNAQIKISEKKQCVTWKWRTHQNISIIKRIKQQNK